MNKKTLGLLLMGAPFFLGSCVDDTYDLNKEISTEIESKDIKLALPLGDLKPFELGTWFQDLDIIETMEDGVYAFAQRDTIEPIEKQPHEIILDIPEQHIRSKIDVSGHMPNIPNIPNLPNVDLSAYLGNVPNPIVVPFDNSNSFSFENPISVQYMCIDSVALAHEEIITLKFKLDGLQALQDSEVLLDLKITLPSFFDEIRSEDPEVKTNKNQITIQKEYPVRSAVGLSFELHCDKINFKNEETSTGLHPEDGVLAYDGDIFAEGTVNINWTQEDLLNNIRDIDEIDVSVDCVLTPMYVQTLNGIFYEEFGRLEQTFIVDLGEQMSTLKESDNTITLSDPHVMVLLNNAISVPINVDLDIVGKDIYGHPIASEEIHTMFPIDPAKYDAITGLVIPDVSELYFTDEPHEKEGYRNIVIPNLGRLLENIPDSITVSIHPDIDKSVTHHIDIYQALNISASYDILVPFKFDSLHINYCDTIAVGLGETLEGVGDASLNLMMNITNSIPLALTLNFTPLDENDEIIEDMTIAPITIAQGEGGSIHEEMEGKSKVTLSLGNNNGSLAKLNKLKLDVDIQSDDASMGLKGIQGLQITDIAIEVAGKMDISNMFGKEKDNE